MKNKVKLLSAVMLIMSLSACGNTMSQTEYEKVVSELGDAKEELESLQSEMEQSQSKLESVQAELSTLQLANEEKGQTSETIVDEEKEIKEEGFTTAIDPITVPDPSTQSEFVVELSAENFMSVFEFKTVNRYDVCGDYDGKVFGFSSLLYEQGWALGNLEGFEVEYSVFGDGKVRETDPVGSCKLVAYKEKAEDAATNLCIYRAKGTLTFYPVEDVVDDAEGMAEYDVRVIRRTLPDGSLIRIYTDLEGTMVY